jgi:hypothetical protein
MKVLIGACAVLTITSCVAGCATPAPASDSVRVVSTLDEVAGCKLVGKVVVSETNPEKEARHQTVTLGGNVLLRKSEQVWNGNAYQCPPAVR